MVDVNTKDWEFDVCYSEAERKEKGYRSKLDRWPRHVTPSEKRPFFDVITLFATYILGQKVDPIRNVTASHYGFWAIKLTQ